MIIGIGCDIVEIKRVAKACERASFFRVLSEREKALCKEMKETRQVEWIAGRFAAKEAIYKAIHTVYPCVITQIEILTDAQGAPYCTLSDYDIKVSIAHEKDYAIAYAMVLSKE